MEISFAAMFAALVAGLLILLIALTLIVLKLGFLLLLVAGPFFLIIGIHPGFGRVIAIRWFEMLVGVLMKQVAIAIVLSRAALLLFAHHGNGGRGPALGAEDPDDRAGHGGRFHLQKAVQRTCSPRSATARSARRSGPSTACARRATPSAGPRWMPPPPPSRRCRATGPPGGHAGTRARRPGSRPPPRPVRPPAPRPRPMPPPALARRIPAMPTRRGFARTRRLRPTGDGDGEVSSGSRRAVSGGGSARAKNLAEADGGARVAPPLDLPPRPGGSGSNGSGSRPAPPPAGRAAPGARRQRVERPRATAAGPAGRPPAGLAAPGRSAGRRPGLAAPAVPGILRAGQEPGPLG